MRRCLLFILLFTQTALADGPYPTMDSDSSTLVPVGFGIKWQWREDRAVNVSLNNLSMGDAPVESPELPGLGQVTGRYTSRDKAYLPAAISFGGGA